MMSHILGFTVQLSTWTACLILRHHAATLQAQVVTHQPHIHGHASLQKVPGRSCSCSTCTIVTSGSHRMNANRCSRCAASSCTHSSFVVASLFHTCRSTDLRVWTKKRNDCCCVSHEACAASSSCCRCLPLECWMMQLLMIATAAECQQRSGKCAGKSTHCAAPLWPLESLRVSTGSSSFPQLQDPSQLWLAIVLHTVLLKTWLLFCRSHSISEQNGLERLHGRGPALPMAPGALPHSVPAAESINRQQACERPRRLWRVRSASSAAV